jgi:hypothetical protein
VAQQPRRLSASQRASIVISADYTWSGSSMHNIIHQTWTIDYQLV